jgi:ribosomal protein L21E
MNHNNVVSFPVKASETLAAGDVVKLHTDGSVAAGSGGTVAAGNIGVVLQDVDQPASGPGMPAAVQLFSAGGIFNIKALGAVAAGVPHNLGTKGLAAAKGTFASGTLVFVPIETVGSAGIVQAIYLGA